MGGSAPNVFGGDVYYSRFADIILTSSSPRDGSVRRRTTDCSIHH